MDIIYYKLIAIFLGMLVISTLVFLFYKGYKEQMTVNIKFKETDEYLESVFRRIQLCESKDTLLVLYREMKNKREQLLFNRSLQNDYNVYGWYLLGKAEGIKSTKIK